MPKGTAKQRQSLTERQQQVAALVGQGLSNKEIAEQLGISEGTVKQHIFAIFRELNLSSRAKLALVGQKMSMRIKARSPIDSGLYKALHGTFSWRLIATVAVTFSMPPEVKPNLLMQRNQLIANYRGLMAELLEALDGRSMVLPDGGMLAWFGHPVAHIDDADRATFFAQTFSALLQSKLPNQNLRFGIGVATHAEAIPANSEQLITTKAFQKAMILAVKSLRSGMVLANSLTHRLAPSSVPWLELKPKIEMPVHEEDGVSKREHIFVIQSVLHEVPVGPSSYWGELQFLNEILSATQSGLAHWLAVESWPPSMATSLMDAIGMKAKRAGFLPLRLHLTNTKQPEQMVRSLLTQIDFCRSIENRKVDQVDVILQLVTVLSELATAQALCIQVYGLQTLNALRDALGPRGIDRLLSQKILFVTNNFSDTKNPQTSIRVLGPRPLDAVFNRVHVLDEPHLDLMPDGVMVDILAVFDDLSPVARYLVLLAAQNMGISIDVLFSKAQLPRPIVQNALREASQSGLLSLSTDGTIEFRDALIPQAITQLNQPVD